MSKELYIDNFRLTVYRAAAEKVMQIADDVERMQQIGWLISKILTERPLMKHCVGITHYRFLPNTTDESIIPHNPQDRSLKLRWADYKAYHDSPDTGILVGYIGDYVDLDNLGEMMNEPLPDPPDWVNDDNNNPFLDEDWENKDHDHITELTELLDALQTEYDLLAAVNSLTQTTPNPAAGNAGSGSVNTLTRHFHSTLTDAELTTIHSDLIKHNYLATDTDLQAWLWVCAGKGKKAPTEPLKWIAQQNELGVFADWICEDYRRTTDWKTVEECFLCKDYETDKTDKYLKPNTKAIKQRNISEEKKTTLKNLLITAKYSSKK